MNVAIISGTSSIGFATVKKFLSEGYKVVEETIKKYGKIDVLANVAGIVGVRAPFIDSELQNIKKVIDVNLNGSINLAYYVNQYMVKARSGVKL